MYIFKNTGLPSVFFKYFNLWKGVVNDFFLHLSILRVVLKCILLKTKIKHKIVFGVHFRPIKIKNRIRTASHHDRKG